MSTFYVPDVLCYRDIPVELKAVRPCGPIEEAQILNALKASKKPVGLLINFGETSSFGKGSPFRGCVVWGQFAVRP